MDDQQSEQAISLYQQGYGYKAIAKMMGFKSATSIKRVITRAGLNDKSRACVAPKTAGLYKIRKDYSKDPVLLAEAQLFAQRQTAKMFTTITDMGFVLAEMPLMEIKKADAESWYLWEEKVDPGNMTEQEAKRLERIALSESGLFEVCVVYAHWGYTENLGYFERPQLINLVTGRLPVDELRATGVKCSINLAFFNNTVKYASNM